ncbi:hypothetical protein LNN31_00550 [Acetobacterium wieringae]|uniref:Uncharacterized protein n=3 Tax=Acetobacterium wieringae TaxID=52694 RepID=A0ABY6HF18_9FIRM|nr:hypothetical protein [Acetobacterium wieringae]UYO62972.1 hypothetical protein LNN31_00550 [Acetobacterium wieringae]
MLKLIEPKEKPVLDRERIYINSTQRALSEYDGTVSTARKLIFNAVRFFIHVDIDLYDRADLENLMDMSNALSMVIAKITPADLMTIFPITKTYDGERYQMKDYFSAMEAVNAHGLHEPFKTADNARALLWEYWNRDIMEYQVKLMSIISAFNQMETGESLLERWIREKDIDLPVHRKYTDQNGNSYMVDGNGRSMPVVKSFPKHIKLLGGLQQ